VTGSLTYTHEGSLERMRVRRLHGVDPRQPLGRLEQCGVLERAHARARERAPADLHDQAIERLAGPRELGHELEAQRLTALDRESVVRTLTRERHRPLGDRALQGVVRRVAGDALLALAHLDRCAQLAQSTHDGLVRPCRNEDPDRTLGGPGDHGRREGRVATARDRELPPLGRRDARLLADEQVHHQTHQVPRLVRAGHVSGLVLHPDLASQAP
jgi:hypothetical protein